MKRRWKIGNNKHQFSRHKKRKGVETMTKIETVKGPLDPQLLGKTITHEHLLWDQACWWKGDPEELSLRGFVHQKVSMENRGQIYFNAHLHLDNIIQNDPDLAIEEAMYFKKAGGNCIVDVSSTGLGRDPKALYAISEVTGLNIIMGSGFYVARSHPAETENMSKEQIAEIIIKEFKDGVKDTGIKPGVIGEIGISDFNNQKEIKMIKAAAIAQKKLGAPLFIHPPFWETKDLEILDIIEKEGADLTKVVLCHCDPTLDKPDYHDAIAKRGANLEYDQFGLEFVSAEGPFLPRDLDRIKAIAEQIRRGNLNHIVISQDVCFKICLIKYGGWGYGHILRNLIPFFKSEGFTNDQLETILVKNPRRILAF